MANKVPPNIRALYYLHLLYDGEVRTKYSYLNYSGNDNRAWIAASAAGTRAQNYSNKGIIKELIKTLVGPND